MQMQKLLEIASKDLYADIQSLFCGESTQLFASNRDINWKFNLKNAWGHMGEVSSQQ